MLDKNKSYKFVGGKLVERTPEELARLERRKAEQATHAPAKKKRTPWVRGPFVMITLTQAEKLLELEPVCWPLFAILLFENFRTRGEPFALPTRELCSLKGLSPANVRRVITQLETSGLILVSRNPPQKPLITVHSLTGERVDGVTRSPVKQ